MSGPLSAYSAAASEALTDLRSLWLVPTLLITVLTTALLSAEQFSFFKAHYITALVIAAAVFVAIYLIVNRRSRTLALILAEQSAEMAVFNKRLVSLNAIGRTVAAELDIERVLTAIRTETQRALDADEVTVELVHADLANRPGRSPRTERRPPTISVKESPPLKLWTAAMSAEESEGGERFRSGEHLSIPLEGPTGDVLGTIRARRIGRPFHEQDRELLRAIAVQVITAIYNARHYEASRRRSSDLRDLVLRGADAIAASDDIARIATLVSRQACKIIACEGAGIFLFGDNRRLLSPVASILADGRPVDGSRAASFYSRPIALGEATLLKAVLSSPGPLAIEDVTAFSEGRAWASYAGIGSLIAAPIVGRVHGTLGVLIVHWSERRTRADSEELGLVGALAAFAAVAIENAKLAATAKLTQRSLSERNERLLEETQRRRAELQKLVHRVGDALVAGLSCDKVAQLVVDQVRQMIPCHRADFWVREPGDLFVPLSGACDPPAAVPSGWKLAGSQFLSEVLNHAHPIVISDVAEDCRLATSERLRLRRDDVSSLLVAPLRGRGDHVIGLLTLYWTSPRHTPTPEEFDTADVLATQAAAALENARLHVQLEEAEQRLSAQLEQTTAARDFVERILQNVQAAVFVLASDVEYIILRANALAEAMPDQEEQHDGLVGRRLGEVFPGIEDALGFALQTAASSGEPVTLIDVPYDGFRRGRTYWTFSITPQRDPASRRISQTIILALDTTDRIRLMQENERNAQRVETLVDISQRLNATLDMDEIYQIVTSGAQLLLAGLDNTEVALYIWDSGSGGFRVAAGSPFGEPTIALLRQLQTSPIVLNDFELDGHADGHESSATAILVPLVSQNAAIGHLALQTTTPLSFKDPRLVDALMNLASLSAAVIRNALAFAYEQNIAETLQRSFIPSMLSQMPGVEIAERYFPTLRDEAEIGGDYYDVILLSPKRLAVFIGDISGKGLAAAVYTAMAKYTLRAFIAQEMSPLEVVSRANVAVARWTGHEIFSTLFFAVIDVEQATLTYVNAGHEPPILVHAVGGVEALNPTGPMLGILSESEFTVAEVSLTPGDVVALYTDGLSDARDASGNFFAEDGIGAHVMEKKSCSVDDICDSLYQKAIAFAVDGRLRDDVALMVVRVLPSLDN